MADGLFIEPLPEEGWYEGLITRKTLPGDSVAQIQPSPSGACSPNLPFLLTVEELRTSAAFGASRRREYLAWRALVRRELGADAVISYNAVGAPVVENYPVHISVSHCKSHVAVCICSSPCAVDIESMERDFSRVLPRYLSSGEQSLSGDPLFPAVAWCAKEALYKLSGCTGLDLLRDLHIEAFDAEAGIVTGRIENGEPFEFSVCRGEGFVAVYFL